MRAVARASVDEDDLRLRAEQIDRIAQDLEVSSLDGVRRVPFAPDRLREIESGRPWHMFPYNPLGIPLAIEVVGGIARATLTLDALHEGPPGLLHGGFAAAMLDAVLGVLVMAEAEPSYTAQLDVSFRHGVPLGTTITVEASLVDIGARRILAEGFVWDGERKAVEARGVFVPIDRVR